MTGPITLTEALPLRDKRVLLRAELNVPIENGVVLDTYRLKQAIATMGLLVREGARTTIIAHLGREGLSLRPVADILAGELPLTFIPALTGGEAEAAVEGVGSGELLLLENVRSDPREEAGDKALAQELARYGELFVQDAFPAMHRHHASIVGVPKLLPSFMGLALEKEIGELSHALEPPKPSLCIIGGAKFETKGPLIEKFLQIYDHVFVGGAIANDLYRARGLSVGTSLVSDTPYDFSPILGHPNLILPCDVVVESGSRVIVKKPDEIAPDERIMDVGPATILDIGRRILECKFILWNGPMGNYEHGYVAQTEGLARVIAASGIYSIVGGGDTVAAIAKLNLESRLGFVSSGGGAMLEFLEKGTLPGIEALKKV